MSETTIDRNLRPPAGRSTRLRLVHFLYGLAILVWSVITFGWSGLFFGIPILGTWTCIFTSRSRLTAFVRVCYVTVICFLLSAFLPPSLSHPEATRRSICGNNLNQIGLALHNYHDAYGAFPPAMVAAKDGRPMHSWRVLLLPFFEKQPQPKTRTLGDIAWSVLLPPFRNKQSLSDEYDFSDRRTAQTTSSF